MNGQEARRMGCLPKGLLKGSFLSQSRSAPVSFSYKQVASTKVLATPKITYERSRRLDGRVKNGMRSELSLKGR